MDSVIENLKTQLRSEFRERRKSFVQSEDQSQNLKDSGQIFIKLMDGQYQKAASYKAVGSEFDPTEIEAQFPKVEWAYPKIEDDGLSFWRPKDQSAFIKNAHKILEPVPESSSQVPVDDLDFVLVPGVAFDRQGGRLGSGKGYYDKTLAQYRGTKIGLAYSVQVSKDELPNDHFDVKMDAIVTEKFAIQAVKVERNS